MYEEIASAIKKLRKHFSQALVTFSLHMTINQDFTKIFLQHMFIFQYPSLLGPLPIWTISHHCREYRSGFEKKMVLPRSENLVQLKFMSKKQGNKKSCSSLFCMAVPSKPIHFLPLNRVQRFKISSPWYQSPLVLSMTNVLLSLVRFITLVCNYVLIHFSSLVDLGSL